MLAMVEKWNSITCQWAVKIFGSLNKAAIRLAYVCGLAALVLVALLTDPRHWFVANIIPRLLELTFLANITFIYGIEMGTLDLMRVFLMVSPMLVMIYFPIFIYNCIHTQMDYGATTGSLAVITTIQCVIIRELLNTMATKEADQKTFNEEGIQQNVSVQDKIKLISSDLPAVFSTKQNSDTLA